MIPQRGVGGALHINGPFQSLLWPSVIGGCGDGVKRGERAAAPPPPLLPGPGGDEGLGRQVELPRRKRFFLAEKSHGSLNLDRKCPSLSAFLPGCAKAGDRGSGSETQSRAAPPKSAEKKQGEQVSSTSPLSAFSLRGVWGGHLVTDGTRDNNNRSAPAGSLAAFSPTFIFFFFFYWRLINKRQIS